jgi:hypothetical protein
VAEIFVKRLEAGSRRMRSTTGIANVISSPGAIIGKLVSERVGTTQEIEVVAVKHSSGR